jgi:hypothetical protein
MNCPRCASAIDDEAARFCPFCGAGLEPPVVTALAAAPHGALCPVHGQPAAGLCSRCGAFMCSACSQGGSGLCSTCRARVGAGAFRLTWDRWSFGELLDIAWERFKADGLMLSLSALVVSGVAFAVGMAGQMGQGVLMLAFEEPGGRFSNPAVALTGAFLTFALQTLVQGALQLGLARLCVESMQGRPAAVGRVFSQVGKAGKLVLQMLAAMMAVLVPLGLYAGAVAGLIAATGGFEDSGRVAIIAVIASLLGIAPFLYWAVPFTFMQLELAANDDVGPVEAIQNCFAIARGHRLAILGVGIVAGLITMAGVIVFCFGVVASMALGQLVIAGLYLTLRSGARLPPLQLPQGE